jgi:hypothetical protein
MTVFSVCSYVFALLTVVAGTAALTTVALATIPAL